VSPRRHVALPRIGVARGALALAFALAGLLAADAALAAQMSAQVTPSEIPLGQTARLTVTVSDVQASPTPRIPAIDGLTVQSLGQTTSVQIVSGSVRAEVAHNYVLAPARTGTFTIPALELQVDGERLRTSPQVLRVIDADAVPRRGVEPRPRADAQEETRPLSLHLRAPERDLYVGELLPLELELRVREGVRVTEATPPTIAGSAFTVSRPKDAQPAQRGEVIDGVRYTIATFPIAVSPVTAGEHPFTAEIEVTAYMPGRRRFGGLAGDPFFDSFFGGGGVPKKITVETEPRGVRVLPLPEPGRPPEFSGAIGRFTVSASATPKQVAVGDPITLTTVVSGTGNFDRLQIPEIASDADWKTYAPSSKLETTDELGYAGRKTSEQAIVPQHAGLGAVPARAFSYFDPERKRYVTVEAEPIALSIVAAPRGAAGGATRARRDAAAGDDPTQVQLAPNKITLGSPAPDRGPLVLRPWFVALQTLPVLALGAGLLWARRRERLRADPAHLRRVALRRRAGAERESLRRAAAAGDARTFFTAARRAVQDRLATDPGRAAESLTLAEMERLVADRPAVADELRAVVAEADAIAYGGAPHTTGELRAWDERVARLLDALERGDAGARR